MFLVSDVRYVYTGQFSQLSNNRMNVSSTFDVGRGGKFFCSGNIVNKEEITHSALHLTDFNYFQKFECTYMKPVNVLNKFSSIFTNYFLV